MRARAAFIMSSIVWLALTPLVAASQDPPPAAGAPCADAVHRQFDFWIGEWEVFAADGSLAGRNRIEKIANGCGLQENWTGARGVTGRSLNAYSAGDGRWHQFWIDAGGLVMHLSGRFEGSTLTLEGVVERSSGPPRRQRLSFTHNPDGTVRQLWHQSSDGGTTWQVVFDGRYVRAG